MDETLAGYTVTMPVRVRWRDCDGLGHVNHVVYLTYFEEARVHYFTSFEELRGEKQARFGFIVAEATCRYLAPALFKDRLLVGTRVVRLGKRSFEMEYLARRPQDDGGATDIASGRTIQVCYDYEAGRSVSMPESFRRRVQEMEGRAF